MNSVLSNKILLLDGDHKNTLAILRNLGYQGYNRIYVVAYNKHSVSLYSKYKFKKFIITSPKIDKDKFYKELLDIIIKEEIQTLLPVSYIAYQICSYNKKELEKYTNITITKYDNIDLASNKVKTYKLAERLEIPHPKSIYLTNKEDVNNVEINYPCVVKGPFESGSNVVEYAKNKQDLINKFNFLCEKHKFKEVLPIIQEYVVGDGYGFFAYYKNGKCIKYFMHKRIREFPVTGGASTCAISYTESKLKEYGEKILDHLNWEGVAMVEFKYDNKTKEYKLMEINPKFWGSLDLALAAGIDFPRYLIYDSLNKEIEKGNSYKDIRYQWIFNGELLHFLFSPKSFFKIFGNLFKSKNDFWFRDIKPNLFQMANIPILIIKSLKK